MLLAAAITRADIANYVRTLIYVYVVVLFLYLLINMVLSFGARPPYSRAFDVVMGFLREVSEPYLRVFRRFIPSIGMIDLSPMIAIFVLLIVNQVVYSLIRG
ncbi:MAG TPA: YggT family protein [Solirubrobacteraceae bacterium]|jgi:YggT family protein